MVKGNPQKKEEWLEGERPTGRPRAQRVKSWRRRVGSSLKAAERDEFSQDRVGTVGPRSLEVLGGLGKNCSGGMGVEGRNLTGPGKHY